MRVQKAYRAVYPDPITLCPGDDVTVERRDDEYPTFVWCTATRTGKSGWVPDAYLDLSRAPATALRDYDAAELSVEVGDELVVLEELGGWLWCRRPTGELGWVPADHVTTTAASQRDAPTR